MFGSIGGPEFVLIAVLALLLFGPRKLPSIGRSIGKALSEFRGATQEFKTSLEREVRVEGLSEAREDLEAARRDLVDAAASPPGKSVPRGSIDPASPPSAPAGPAPGPTAPAAAPRPDADEQTDGDERGRS